MSEPQADPAGVTEQEMSELFPGRSFTPPEPPRLPSVEERQRAAWWWHNTVAVAPKEEEK
jgi:hypothetical protein